MEVLGRKGYPHFVGLFIGIPLTGRFLPPEWAFGFHALSPPMNFNVHYGYTKGKDVHDARNWIAEQAVESNSKYLFFLGEDNVPPPHCLRELIFVMEHRPEIGVVGGIYCHKAHPPSPMVFRGNGAGAYWDWKVGELFEVSGLGMDCTLIRTEVLKKLTKPWFMSIDDISQFLEGTNKGEQWTEDLYFCKKVLEETEYKVYADGGVLCDHYDMRTGKAVSLPANCLPLRRAGHAVGEKKIIDLGSGEVPYETDEGTVLKVDIRDDVDADYRCDIRWLPFGTGEFDIVYSSHTLEHLPREQTLLALREWVRVMKPDGEMRIIVPSLKWAAEELIRVGVNEDVLNVLYGAQTYGENYHRTGFTPDTLAAMLKELGFKKIDVTLTGYNICMRGWKIPPKEEPKAVAMPGVKGPHPVDEQAPQLQPSQDPQLTVESVQVTPVDAEASQFGQHRGGRLD